MRTTAQRNSNKVNVPKSKEKLKKTLKLLSDTKVVEKTCSHKFRDEISRTFKLKHFKNRTKDK